MNFIDTLCKKGILNKEKAESLRLEIQTSEKTEEEVILEKKVIDEDSLFELKSKDLKIPFLKEAAVKEITAKILELIPEESARHYRMIPLSKKGRVLEVGMVYPENIKAQEGLKFLGRQGRFSYEVFLITPSALEVLLKQYRTLTEEVGAALEELETEI